MTIRAVIRNKRISIEGDPVIVCGNGDYVIQFDFDAEWSAMQEKTARFIWNANGVSERIADVPITDGSCAVPMLRNVCQIAVAVFSSTGCSSTFAAIPCVPCITDGHAVQEIPQRDVYNELMELVNQKTR